jgi:hypothetical protein
LFTDSLRVAGLGRGVLEKKDRLTMTHAQVQDQGRAWVITGTWWLVKVLSSLSNLWPDQTPTPFSGARSAGLILQLLVARVKSRGRNPASSTVSSQRINQ